MATERLTTRYQVNLLPHTANLHRRPCNFERHIAGRIGVMDVQEVIEVKRSLIPEGDDLGPIASDGAVGCDAVGECAVTER